MKENEYILVTNLSKVKIALDVMRDTLAGFDGVITQDERQKIIMILGDWQEKAHKKISKINLIEST